MYLIAFRGKNYHEELKFKKKKIAQIQVDDMGKIVDARFKTFGCGSAIASSSLATEWIKGKSVSAAIKDHIIRSVRCCLSTMFFLLSGG